MARYQIENGELVPVTRSGSEIARARRYNALSQTAPTPRRETAPRPRRQGRTTPAHPVTIQPATPAVSKNRPMRGARRNAAYDAETAGVRFAAPPRKRAPGQPSPPVAAAAGPAPSAECDTQAGAVPSLAAPACAYCGRAIVGKRAGAKFCSGNCKSLYSYHQGPKPSLKK
jgi:hypothetical protein